MHTAAALANLDSALQDILLSWNTCTSVGLIWKRQMRIGRFVVSNMG